MDDGTVWLMRIEGGLSAHFKLADFTSRPGTLWQVALKRGDELRTAAVKDLLTSDATAATRQDTRYQAQTTMQYLDDRIAHGWHPREVCEHTIHIGNPRGCAPAKPWWKPG